MGSILNKFTELKEDDNATEKGNNQGKNQQGQVVEGGTRDSEGSGTEAKSSKEMPPKLDDRWKGSPEEDEIQIVKRIYREATSFDLKTVIKNTTVLNCLTRAIGTVPEEKEECLKMFDYFISMAPEWWKTNNEEKYEKVQGNGAKYLAIRSLTTEILEESELSVMQTAFKYKAVEVIKEMMLMENVNSCTLKQLKKYDISYVIPGKTAGISCLGFLREKHPLIKEILQIEPLKELNKFYNSVTTRFYCMLILIHVMYMSLYTYSSFYLLKRNVVPHESVVNVSLSMTDNLKNVINVTPKYIFYSIVPLEPIVILIYLTTIIKEKSRIVQLFKEIYVTVLTLFFFVTVSMSIFLSNSPTRYYTVSLSLLLGWLITCFFSRGIPTFHFFFKVIYQIILDILKLMFVYVMFFLAFSFAIHAQFLSSPEIQESYKTPIHTIFLMFNVMLGMGEKLVDPEIEDRLEDAGLAPVFSKLLYTVYVVFVPIILLNLLIAMMNTSYSRILKQHSRKWKIKSMIMGFKDFNSKLQRVWRFAEKRVPFLAKLTGVGTVHYGKMFSYPGGHEKDVWYIEITTKTQVNVSDIEQDETETLNENIQLLSKKIENKFHNMETILEALKTQMTKIENDRMARNSDKEPNEMKTLTENTQM